ncbi:uncharacterized protein LOC110092314 isoform X1 [Dendrobium catenatum]|uniref:uncharacterized protein LOC110092314 isoform X1 n=1 Tax=Dendrobium catenatum TaxID=906689 RepID=UPI00109F57A7|nr:uncharacterized protein LOC110092314 isoform X1 [Dendrobium catenatum]
MKGRSHRPPPSAPLEDWGDGQWTVDCSCGVNFDDGEEMVSCDECGIWVHTRCSHYVRGEASFACHNCKAATKRSRTIVTSAANNFAHDTEETEVAQLLVELPTKADRPPPIHPGGAPLRPPFRLWAHVPMEERVHVQGVPGGDSSLFRGLSSKIFSPELWKRTGYVPKKFNLKYKEFPCWEEEERDKASLGADALFSLSKESVQATPVKSSEKMLSPDGSWKEGEKILLGTRSFGCAKKERNKLRVLGSSKFRKEELGEEKELSGRRRSRGDFDRMLTDIKEKAGSVPLFDSRKEDLCEDGDGGLHIAESDVPDTKSAYKREDMLLKPSYKNLDEGIDNVGKSKHNMLVFKTSRSRFPDEAPRSKLLLGTPVKLEKADRPDGRVACKLNTVAACHVEGSNIAKGFIKQEILVHGQHMISCYLSECFFMAYLEVIKSASSFKEPKDDSYIRTVLNEGSIAAVLDLDKDKINAGIDSYAGQPDVTDITFVPSSASCSLSAKKVEINLKLDVTDDQALESSDFLPRLFPDGRQCIMDDFPQNQLKLNDCSSTIPDESKALTNPQYEEQKPQVLQKDSDHQECLNTSGNEPVLNEVITDSVGSLKRWKCPVESNPSPKTYCTASMKLNGAEPSHSAPLVQKTVGTGKDLPNLTALVGSKSKGCNNQNSAANAVSSSLSGKAIHAFKQQRVKVTNSSAGARDTPMNATSTEKDEQEVLPQSALAHPTGVEFMGSKSLQAAKTSHFSASKNCSLDSKEQPSGPSCQASAETPTTSSAAAEATTSVVIQSPSNQLKSTALGSSQKNDKTIQPSTQSASKFLSHSLVMQASTSTNAATTLSDEELALLLHQELNSSPRVPRVPRIRQTTNAQFATPSTTSVLSKRSYSGGRDQVSVGCLFFRRKHKEASKESSRHSRDAISEGRKVGIHSPEPKQDEPAVFSDGFSKRGKGSRPYDTMESSKTNLSGSSIEGANSFPASSEENGARTSLQTSPANVDGDAALVGRSLPCLIDEIMSKGKCSTYEELCDAVRPYWHSLRKPNGERYAYSSHSQAVLDCLRNRSEWAHLIDRGPKTNASKRRRKLDSETPAMELEHENNSGNPHRDDFPKGKRNVRKRRLLEQRSGGVKDAKNTRSQGNLSDDDPAALSHSSNEETECHLSDDNGADDACSLSSGDSD